MTLQNFQCQFFKLFFFLPNCQTPGCVRNTCAHGGLLYDMALYPLIRRGPANVSGSERKKLYGALKVVGYLLKQVSANRAAEFEKEVEDLLKKYATTPAIKTILRTSSGFPV